MCGTTTPRSRVPTAPLTGGLVGLYERPNMITSSSGGDGGPPTESQPTRFAPVLLIVVPIMMLMIFSVVAILLNQAALAVMAGTAGVGLAAEAGRRALHPPGTPSSAGAELTVR
jgi:hypothetical protein